MTKTFLTLGLSGLVFGPLAAPPAWAGTAHDRGIEIQEAPFRSFGPSVTARLYMAASPRQVYEALMDYEHLHAFMPRVDEATRLEARDGWVKVRFRVRVMGMVDLVEVDERTLEPGRRIRWHAVEGPLKTSDGSWTLTPQGAGTEVTYQTDVDPGIPVPPGLTGFLVRRGLPDLLENVRRRAESGGTWKKR